MELRYYISGAGAPDLTRSSRSDATRSSESDVILNSRSNVIGSSRRDVSRSVTDDVIRRALRVRGQCGLRARKARQGSRALRRAAASPVPLCPPVAPLLASLSPPPSPLHPHPPPSPLAPSSAVPLDRSRIVLGDHQRER